MASFSSSSRIFLTALSLLAIQSLAQNNTNTTDSNRCGRDIGPLPDAPVNSTGDISFQFSNLALPDQWHLSLTLNDTSSSSPARQRYSIEGYISVPDNTKSSACLYMFTGIDAAGGTGNNGCEGVLDQGCVDYLVSNLQYSGLRCPSLKIADISKACGNAIVKNGVVSTTNSIDFSNQTCTLPSPPGGIALPEKYRTWPTFGVDDASENPGGDASNFTLYDRSVRRPIPWVIGASANGRMQTQVVCVAPKDIVPGSRVPQGKFPNVGVSVRSQFKGWLTTMVAAILSVGFAFG